MKIKAIKGRKMKARKNWISTKLKATPVIPAKIEVKITKNKTPKTTLIK